MSACAAEAALLELSAAGGQSPLKSRKLVSHESVAASLCLDLGKIVSCIHDLDGRIFALDRKRVGCH